MKRKRLWIFYLSFSLLYGIAGYLMGEPFSDTLKVVLAVGFFIWWGRISKQIDDDERRN